MTQPFSPPEEMRDDLVRERRNISDKVKRAPYKTRRHIKGIEANRLFEAGYTNDQIAYVLGVSDGREVRRLRKEAETIELDGPDPKRPEELTAELKAMVQPWLTWRAHYEGCKSCWDDSFTGHDQLVTKAVNGFVQFHDHFNRAGETVTAHGKEWVWAAMRHIRLLLNVPPRHAKSHYLSVWLPIFLLCANRDFQVLVVSQTGDFAKKFCRMIAEEMTYNVDLIDGFGRFVPSDPKKTWSPSQGQLKIEGSSRGDRSIQIRGARQQILGMEADWITCDDPDDPETARSQTEEAKLREWLDEQVISRGAPGCHVTVIGQRVGVRDIYSYIEKKRAAFTPGSPPVYKHILMPAVEDWEKGTVLWPEVWPFERLMKERYNDSPEVFETMYQQNPKTAGESIFLPEWIFGGGDSPGCIDEDRAAGTGFPRGEGLPVARVLSIDPSPTQYSAFIVADTVASQTEQHIALIHMESIKVHGKNILEKADELIRMYRPDYVIIEESAVSSWIWQDPWLQRAKELVEVRSHKTTAKSKGDPEWGFQALAPAFAAGQIRFPMGDPEGKAMSDLLLQEMWTYSPDEREKFDLLMALWFIRYAYRALVPRTRYEGGFRGTRPGARVSPAVQRAQQRRASTDQVVKEWRKKHGRNQG